MRAGRLYFVVLVLGADDVLSWVAGRVPRKDSSAYVMSTADARAAPELRDRYGFVVEAHGEPAPSCTFLGGVSSDTEPLGHVECSGSSPASAGCLQVMTATASSTLRSVSVALSSPSDIVRARLLVYDYAHLPRGDQRLAMDGAALALPESLSTANGTVVPIARSFPAVLPPARVFVSSKSGSKQAKDASKAAKKAAKRSKQKRGRGKRGRRSAGRSSLVHRRVGRRLDQPHLDLGAVQSALSWRSGIPLRRDPRSGSRGRSSSSRGSSR